MLHVYSVNVLLFASHNLCRTKVYSVLLLNKWCTAVSCAFFWVIRWANTPNNTNSFTFPNTGNTLENIKQERKSYIWLATNCLINSNFKMKKGSKYTWDCNKWGVLLGLEHLSCQLFILGIVNWKQMNYVFWFIELRRCMHAFCITHYTSL